MKNKYSLFILLVSLFYISFIQFYHLGKLPIVQWDESRLAVNAVEMDLSGNYLVTTFEKVPDLYNTKPPLMIWLQVASIKCFGAGEWAIRFPSAMAGFCTILLVGFMVFKINKNIYSACLAMLTLTTCDGFINLHGSMTGDYDALLALSLMLGVYFCRAYLLTGRKGHLFLFTLFVALSVFTKSAAALIFFPVYFALFFYETKLKNMGRLSIALFVALLPFLLFCILRENAAPGFLKAMWHNDFGGRFANGRDGHEGEWYYYIIHLFSFRFSWFIWLLPFAVVWGIYRKNREVNFMSIILLLYLIIVSLAKTKLEWYDIPVLPVISVILTLFLYGLIKETNFMWLKSGCYVLIVVCLSWSLFEKFNFTFSGKNRRLSMDIYEISEILRNHQGPDKLYYYSGSYDAWNYFYTLVKPNVKRADYKMLKAGDKIVTDNAFSDSLKLSYQILTLDSSSHVKTVRITGIK